MKAKAREHYLLGLDTARKYFAYNEWGLKCAEGLTRLAGKPMNFRDVILVPDYVGSLAFESVVEGLGSPK